MIAAIALILWVMSGVSLHFLWRFRVYKRMAFDLLIFSQALQFVGLSVILVCSLVGVK